MSVFEAFYVDGYGGGPMGAFPWYEIDPSGCYVLTPHGFEHSMGENKEGRRILVPWLERTDVPDAVLLIRAVLRLLGEPVSQRYPPTHGRLLVALNPTTSLYLLDDVSAGVWCVQRSTNRFGAVITRRDSLSLVRIVEPSSRYERTPLDDA